MMDAYGMRQVHSVWSAAATMPVPLAEHLKVAIDGYGLARCCSKP